MVGLGRAKPFLFGWFAGRICCEPSAVDRRGTLRGTAHHGPFSDVRPHASCSPPSPTNRPFQLTAVEQFTALAAIGLEYYSLRFIDVGKGVKNVMKLSLSEIQKIRHLEDQYGLNVASIASPIGKDQTRRQA